MAFAAGHVGTHLTFMTIWMAGYRKLSEQTADVYFLREG
jgi:hypothetical protein